MLNTEQTYSSLQLADRLPSGKFQGNLPTSHSSSIFICPSFLTTPQGVSANAQPTGNANADTMWVNGSATPKADGSYFMVYGHNSTTSPNYGSDGRPFLICYQWNSKIVTPVPAAGIANVDTVVVNTATPNITTVAQANLLLMSEKRVRQDELQPNDPENPCMQIDPTYYNYYYYPLCQSKGSWARFTTRHSDGGNLLFVDGHVEYAKYRDVVTPLILPAGGNNNIANWNHPGKWIWNPVYPAN
jgi:prepilin-type processing-associated H-X9-DG protein